jgi:N-acetylmuramoyl-L-alanine amidase
MFKIALTAGHYKYTAGKRCLKSLDKNETRAWALNDRICDKVEKLLKDYEGYSLIRTDDTTGEKALLVEERVDKANKFGADIYISVHHNAGIYGGKGGGIIAYTYTKVDSATKAWQKDLYKALIKHTGLKGNRSVPLATADLGECRLTAMPAVLLELGFMDSATDVPIILTDDYATKCAKAIVEVIVKRGKLTKKPVVTEPTGKIYRVQVGAFSNKANAEKLASELKKKGYNAVIKEDK